VRRTTCDPWREDLQSDFNSVLNSIRHGFRAVSDPEVVGCYRDLASDRQEFRRKVRTIVRGITVLMDNLPLLNPFRYGTFSWQLFSHKLCRWLVPLWLILALVSNLFLATAGGLYAVLLITQVAFYASGLLVLVSIDLPRLSVLKIAGYFLSTNLAIAAAWVRYFRGERFAVWQPSAR
jgi:hypothetical protein